LAAYWAVLACAGWGVTLSEGGENPAQVAAQPAAANDSARASAQLVRIPLPITGEVDTHTKSQIEHLLAHWGESKSRPILVLEFRGADDKASGTSEFERALSLARYLAGDKLNRVRTVAWLSGAVNGHAVLPVLACEEIVAHPDAEFGRAGINETFIDATVRSGYVEIAERRRTVPVAVVLGMLDPQLAVFRVETQQGARYVLEPEVKQQDAATVVRSVEKVKPEGELGRLTGSELRLKFGFASHLARDRMELAAALRVPAGGIEEDPTLGEDRRAVRVDVDGPIRPELVTWVERGLREKIDREGVNFVCLMLDTPGGSPEDSVRLASYLSGLDPSEIRTVAFVASEARSDAALIAFACDQLVMGERAVLGGPGAGRIGARKREHLREPIREIAAAKGRGWSVAMALLDPDLKVRAYTRGGTGEVRYFCEEELAEQKDAAGWQAGDAWSASAGLRGREAVAMKLAKSTVADWDDLRRMYHLEQGLDAVRPNWAHRIIEFLASPKIAGTLLFIGWFALMVEFMSPGLSVAGFTSAVCFVLFFWANFLHGTAGWLEILLFATGLGCLALEIFVLPGFGAFGIGGGLLIVASLVLASQTFVVPRNAYEWSQLPASMFMVVAAGAGVCASLAFARRLLTEAPVFRRISLETPAGEQLEQIRYRESLVHREYLVGKRGVTMTQLTPSGKARFGDEFVDVISEGEVIPRGADVYVVEVIGNEVVVRAAP
jgi:membrane-bound ClpP family serine protease